MIEVITGYNDFLGLSESWNSVLEKSRNDSVFLTFEWMQAWWKVFGKDKQLLVILVKDDSGELIGIAPLMLHKRKVSFIYNHHSSYADFIICADAKPVLEAVIGYLKENKRQWDIIELENIPKESSNYPVLIGLLKREKFFLAVKDGLRSPFIRIE
ncbi:MAG: hypothetical protein PHT31_07565, partial [Candidatus Omnitrophica bacterium]|nr:hypothetical protein [Candidatus Omnitrophota bacterium]